MTQPRILMATDVPFWRAENGAQQRMDSLVRFLSLKKCKVRVFFLGDPETRDSLAIEARHLDVAFQSSDRPPDSFFEKAVWWASATSYKIRTTLGMINRSPFDMDRSLALADFDWPWARARFNAEVADFKPDTILAEYIKMAYLVDGLPSQTRKEIHCALDTHDVLHLRMQQFHESGHQHWLEIDRAEEAAAVSLFDTVIAIQPHEAETFREMAPQSNIITCGHSCEPFPEFKITAHDSSAVRIGYLASNNGANQGALKRLIEMNQTLSDKIQLVIAGGVCDDFENYIRDASDDFDLSNVKVIGRVESLAEFYDQVDAVINLVQFGSGLKIKNVEALSFGKPLITSLHGIEGMIDANSDVVFASDSLKQIAKHVHQLALDREHLSELQTKAFQFAQSEYSDSRAYDEFLRCLSATT